MTLKASELNAPIRIFRVNSEIAKELSRFPNPPHSHNYEEIIVVIQGSVAHYIDFESRILNAPFVSFITKSKTHQIKPLDENAPCDGFLIQFKSEFVSEIIFQLYYVFHSSANVIFKTDKEFERFVNLSHMLYEEIQKEDLDYAIARSLLCTMLTILEAEKRKTGSANSLNKRDKRFITFLKLLEENYAEQLDVAFYANTLSISSRSLNLICQEVLQKSVTEIIQTRRLVEAKHLLLTTKKSINEIGFETGYKDKSYFSNIFKKRTGETPSEFRNNHR